jgi:pimeloyl-ACP methyl ester carboxylesterase
MLKPSSSEIEIITPYCRLAAKKWGSDDGIPAIGLHGWMDNANTFDGLAPLLPRLQLVAMDLPGHGLSEHRPAGMHYHYTDYVDDVIALADALGWREFDIIGHSMGAGVAVFLAGAFPERVRRLMLIEGLGAVAEPVGDGPGRLRQAVLKHQQPQRKSPQRPRAFTTLVRARSQAGTIKPYSAETLVRRSATTTEQGAVWHSDARVSIRAAYFMDEEYVQSFLKKIQAPVLLVVAKDGMLKKRPYFHPRLGVIKDLQTVWLPGNHHLHLDEPEPVAQAINEFMAIGQ